MAKKILGVLVFVLFLVLLVPSAFAGNCSTGAPPASGNWTVNNTTTCGNMTIDITEGNVTLGSNATLTFENVTLQFNSVGSYVPRFSALNGSWFGARNSTFTTNDTATPVNYSVNFSQGSTASINDSIIEYANNGQASPVGMLITGNRTSVSIRNTTFSNCNNSSLSVADGASTTLSNLTIEGSGTAFTSKNATTSLENSTINSITWDVSLVNDGNLTIIGVPINVSKISPLSGSSVLNVSHYVQAYTNTTGMNSAPVSSADVEAFSTNTTSEHNASTNGTGWTNTFVLTQVVNSSSTNESYNQYNITANKSTGGYNYSNSTYVNITSNLVGSNAVNVQLDYPNPVVNLQANETTPTVKLQNHKIIKLWVNNTGNILSNATIKDNIGTSGWSFSYYSTNSTHKTVGDWLTLVNLSSFDNETVYLRIEPPNDAVRGKTYSFNLTANLTPYNSSSDLYNTSRVQVNVTINTEVDNWGGIVQNATDFLEGDQSADGSWSSSNFTTAWAFMALNITHGSNNTSINNSLHYFNDTQNGSGVWTDATHGDLTATSAILIAHKEAGHSNTEFSNLTKAAEYLQARVNSSMSVGQKSLMLVAIYKTLNSVNPNTTNALDNLTAQQLDNGSWNNNFEDTLLATWALNSAGNDADSNNLSNARNWMEETQNLDGSFVGGSTGDLSVVALIVFTEEDSSDISWNADLDHNNSTSNDVYPGSLRRAVNRVITQRNSAAGAWGTPDAISTGLAVSGLSKTTYASVSGQINGTGNTTGYDIANQTVQFSGSSTYTTTTNGTGYYTVNLPADDYTISLDSNIYYLNKTYYANLSSGQNLTLNMGALPKINLEPKYGDYIDGGGTGLEQLAEKTSTNIGISNATYAHGDGLSLSNTSTYNINSSPSNSNFNKSGNLSNSAAFDVSVTLPKVDNDTTYTINITVSDGNSSVTASEDLEVTNNGTSDSSDSSSSSPGGGGASQYGLVVQEYDKELSFSQGETAEKQLVAKNSGVSALTDVGLSLVGVDDSWYDVVVSDGSSSTTDLEPDESVTFKTTFNIPNDAKAKTYPATWRVQDSGENALGQKNMNLTIIEVWTEDTVSNLNATIVDLETNLSTLSNKIAELKDDGENVTSLEAKLTDLNESIQEAESKYDAGEYTAANNAVDDANELISEMNSDIEEIEGGPGVFDGGISLGKIGAAVLVLGIAAVAGILIWYKFMRVVPISEIKQYPDRFTEGAQLEGVIKSINSTKKGKVFLVKDHTGKIHVRYPYHSTLREGNMMRARGVVKTYKGTAYMDATDIHRVAVTGKSPKDILVQLKKKLSSLKPSQLNK